MRSGIRCAVTTRRSKQQQKALAPYPLYGFGLGTIYIQQGKYDQASMEVQLAGERLGNNPSPFSELALMHPAVGKLREAQNILARIPG
jgi:hypothetical protein